MVFKHCLKKKCTCRLCPLFQPQTIDSIWLWLIYANVPTKHRRFFSVLEELYAFCSGSSIHSQFIKLQKQMYPQKKPTELKRIFTLRWTSEVHTCMAVRNTLSSILVPLNDIEFGSTDRRSEAMGLLNKIDFIFVLNLCVFQKILY